MVKYFKLLYSDMVKLELDNGQVENRGLLKIEVKVSDEPKVRISLRISNPELATIPELRIIFLRNLKHINFPSCLESVAVLVFRLTEY